MVQMVETQKLMQVRTLNEGDRVKLTNGKTADFVRLKQKKFIGLMNGIAYDIPVNMLVEVIEKVDVKGKEETLKKEYLSLEKDELFYISRKGDALVFKFDTFRAGKIIGINPITKSVTRIEPGLYGGKVANL